MDKKRLIDTLMIAIDQALANLHTATIAKVTKVNASTINCRPVINRMVDGQSVQLPEFVDVPPLFLQGGSSYTAHPVAVGDYCLLVFTERCFDRWYDGQDFQSPLELRMHDYSDGIAIVGINPLAGAITIPTVIQRTGDTNEDGDITHQGDRTQTGNQTIVGNLHVDGNVTVTGNITCQGTIAAGNFTGLGGGTMTASVDIESTGDIKAGNVSLNGHTHTDSVGGTTSAPN